MIAISTALTLSGYNNPNSITAQFGYDYNYTTDYFDPNENLTTQGINPESQGTGIISGITQFFDRYVNIQGFVTRVFSFFIAPVGVLSSVSAPKSLIFLVSGIWGILWAIAIASFIWRKDL